MKRTMFRQEDGYLYVKGTDGKEWGSWNKQEATQFRDALEKAILRRDDDSLITFEEPDPVGEPPEEGWDKHINYLTFEEAKILLDTVDRAIKFMEGKWA